MPYGDWMNGLQGMTTALGAASPYAQQLAENNARQGQLAQLIRSGSFGGSGGYGGGYPPQPGFNYGGGAPTAPQPYMPTPFTGFKDILNPQPKAGGGVAPYISGGGEGDSRFDGETEPGSELPPAKGVGHPNFGSWWNEMKTLPAFIGQFTPSGMVRDIYRSGGFDGLLRKLGLNGTSAATPAGISRIEGYSSPENNYGSVGATYAPISKEVSDQPDWWNAEDLRLPKGELTQQGIRDWSNKVNAAAEAEQWGELPGYTRTPAGEPTSPTAPQPVASEPLLSPENYIAGLLANQDTAGMQWLNTPGGGTWVPNDYQDDYQDTTAAEEPQWNYNFDTGEWDKL